MNEEKSIRFAMLVSPVAERQENARRIKEIIPTLELINADKKECDLFSKHLEVLRTDPEKYKGICMMEDDIILSENFSSLFDNAVRLHGDGVIQFFERALRKKPLKRGYAYGAEFYSCVCYYMPSEFTRIFCSDMWVNSFKKWFSSLNEPWNYPIDTYIQYVLKNNRLVYWREFPWIVQHGKMKSNFKGRPLNRQSIFFVDDIEKEFKNGKTEN